MKARTRIDQIAERGSRSTTARRSSRWAFKAFVVAVDREACTTLYKQALDRHLPPDWSRA